MLLLTPLNCLLIELGLFFILVKDDGSALGISTSDFFGVGSGSGV